MSVTALQPSWYGRAIGSNLDESLRHWSKSDSLNLTPSDRYPSRAVEAVNSRNLATNWRHDSCGLQVIIIAPRVYC